MTCWMAAAEWQPPSGSRGGTAAELVGLRVRGPDGVPASQAGAGCQRHARCVPGCRPGRAPGVPSWLHRSPASPGRKQTMPRVAGAISVRRPGGDQIRGELCRFQVAGDGGAERGEAEGLHRHPDAGPGSPSRRARSRPALSACGRHRGEATVGRIDLQPQSFPGADIGQFAGRADGTGCWSAARL